MNLSFILKALGVKITPEQAAQIEAIIPQIPGKLQELVALVNNAVQNFDKRLQILEQQIELVRVGLEVLNGRIDDSSSEYRPAGIGATQRAVERGDAGDRG